MHTPTTSVKTDTMIQPQNSAAGPPAAMPVARVPTTPVITLMMLNGAVQAANHDWRRAKTGVMPKRSCRSRSSSAAVRGCGIA
jgi:hypothetical protein